MQPLPFPVAVLDVETTGFSGCDRILEIGILTFDESRTETDTLHTLIQPDRDIPNTDIHGLTASTLRDAPLFSEVAGQIAALIDGRVVVAHNCSFDTRMLRQEFDRLDFPFPVGPSNTVDTMRLSHQLLPGAPKKLSAALAAAQLSNKAAHTAFGDAAATAQLFFYLADHGARLTKTPVTLPAGLLRLNSGELLPRPVRTGQPETDTYQQMLVAALDDGVVTEAEREFLVRKAGELGLEPDEAQEIHRDMLARMAMMAWADGVLTDTERELIKSAAQNLKVSDRDVEQLLIKPDKVVVDIAAGARVSFTGELTLPRDEWESRVRARGLTVGGVTKRTAVLVAADPETRSGKAKKARSYNVPIISEAELGWLLNNMPGELEDAAGEAAPAAATATPVDATDDEGFGSAPGDLAALFPWAQDATSVGELTQQWITLYQSEPLASISPHLSMQLFADSVGRFPMRTRRWLNRFPNPLQASVAELYDLPGFGPKTVASAVEAVVLLALDGSEATEDDVNAAHPQAAGGEAADRSALPGDAPAREEHQAAPAAPTELAGLEHEFAPGAVDTEPTPPQAGGDAARVVDWWALTKQSVEEKVAGAPAAVQLAARRLDAGAEAIRLGCAQKACAELNRFFGEDERYLPIFTDRIIASHPLRLEDLGARFGVSRQRVRQLQSKVNSFATEMLAASVAALAHRVRAPQLRSDFLAANPDFAIEIAPSITLLEVAVALSDAVRLREGFVEPEAAADALSDTAGKVADEYGVVSAAQLAADCGLGEEMDQDTWRSWVESVMPDWTWYGEHLLTQTRSQPDRGVAVLALEGHPMTTEELSLAIATGTVTALDNGLALDPRVHRVAKGTWALKAWGGEEFTTVARWIANRVDPTGSVALTELIAQAPEVGIAESTVRTYCASGEFTTVDGMVMRNTEEVVVDSNPQDSAGMYYRDGSWQLLVTINHDHLRGSGFAVPRCLVGMHQVSFLGKKEFTSELGPQELRFGRTNASCGTIRR